VKSSYSVIRSSTSTLSQKYRVTEFFSWYRAPKLQGTKTGE
jgi:hypothetical protein